MHASAKAAGVHRDTSLRRRHRFLSLAKHARAGRLGGVAASRGITRAHVCNLVARERTGQPPDFITAARRSASGSWALDGERITSPERLPGAALGICHT